MGGGLFEQPFLHIQVNDLVELRHRFGSPVIVLHQRLTGASGVTLLRGWGGQPQVLRHRGLQIKHQTVFSALGDVVQSPTHQREQLFIARKLA